MAAMIQCDCCGEPCAVKEAMHIRVHKLKNAEEYYIRDKLHRDVCPECYARILLILNKDQKK